MTPSAPLVLSRRHFLGGSLAFAAAPLLASNPGARVARIGIMTDTHVYDELESCSRVKAALELFKAQGAEMVINCGDIADWHCPEGYRFYRQTFNSVYPAAATRPKEIYAYAAHDVGRYKGPDGSIGAFKELKRLLEAPNDPTCAFTWKGLPFLVFPQFTGKPGYLTWAEYAKAVDDACKANPGKPVFVIDHVPPAGTTFHSWTWGSEGCRKALEGHPQVVSISGHVHGSLASERQIWQGSFTAINFGCLQTWGGFAAGSTPPPQGKPNYGVAVMDVYADRLVIRRYDVRDGSEYFPDDPWIVPLPFAAKSAPYAREAHLRHVAARRPLPTFAPGAKVTVKAVEEGLSIAFPEAASPSRAFAYRLVCSRRTAAGTWVPFTRDDMFGDFWQAEKERTGQANYVLGGALFAAGEKIRVSVTPLDCFERPSKAIETAYTVPSAPATVGEVAAEKIAFTENRKTVPRSANGWFAPTTGQGTAWFPKEILGDAKPGAKLVLVVDLHTVCADEEWHGWRVTLPSFDRKTTGWMQMPPGDCGPLRYALPFTLGKRCPKKIGLAFNGRLPNGRLKFIAAKVVEVV